MKKLLILLIVVAQGCAIRLNHVGKKEHLTKMRQEKEWKIRLIPVAFIGTAFLISSQQ